MRSEAVVSGAKGPPKAQTRIQRKDRASFHPALPDPSERHVPGAGPESGRTRGWGHGTDSAPAGEDLGDDPDRPRPCGPPSRDRPPPSGAGDRDRPRRRPRLRSSEPSGSPQDPPGPSEPLAASPSPAPGPCLDPAARPYPPPALVSQPRAGVAAPRSAAERKDAGCGGDPPPERGAVRAAGTLREASALGWGAGRHAGSSLRSREGRG